MTDFARLIAQETFSRDDLVAILGARDVKDIDIIRRAAEAVLLEQCGPGVYLRGLVESSNACNSDCLYCGIRKSNKDVHRYTLSVDSILECVQLCSRLGYGSTVIQSGKRSFEPVAPMSRVYTRCIMRSNALATIPRVVRVP